MGRVSSGGLGARGRVACLRSAHLYCTIQAWGVTPERGGKPGSPPRGVLARGITDINATGFFKGRNRTGEKKGAWQLAKDVELLNYDHSPWKVLLRHYRCQEPQGLRQTPRPCVWRRPLTGAVADQIGHDARWDWRCCRLERKVRLAMQQRFLAPTTDRASAGDTDCVPPRRALAGDTDSVSPRDPTDLSQID